MNQPPTRLQLLLEEITGPGLLGFAYFSSRVLLGLLYIPLRFIGLIALWTYRILLWLNARGEELVTAYDNFIHARRDQ